jgi:DUF917 family protein
MDVSRRTTEGFLRGTVRLDGLVSLRGRRFDLAFRNEWAVGWPDGEPHAMRPDLICVLEMATLEAIGTETLRHGQRASVIALPAPPVFRSERGLSLIGPRAFGHDLDVRSVFAPCGAASGWMSAASSPPTRRRRPRTCCPACARRSPPSRAPACRR